MQQTQSHFVHQLVDQQKNVILSHLHRTIKPVNQLRMIEDSLVIYRILDEKEESLRLMLVIYKD